MILKIAIYINLKGVISLKSHNSYFWKGKCSEIKVSNMKYMKGTSLKAKYGCYTEVWKKCSLTLIIKSIQIKTKYRLFNLSDWQRFRKLKPSCVGTQTFSCSPGSINRYNLSWKQHCNKDQSVMQTHTPDAEAPLPGYKDTI